MKKKVSGNTKSLIISLFAVLSCLTASHASAQTARVTIGMRQVKMEQVMNEKQEVVKPKDFDFVINDDLTYTLIAEFRSPEAQKMAAWWKEGQEQLAKNKETLQQLRDAFAQGNESRKQQLRQQILTMEQAYEKLYYGLEEQEVKIRNTEINYLKNSK